MSKTTDTCDRMISDALGFATLYQQTLHAVFFAYYGFLYLLENPDCLSLAREPEFLAAVEEKFALTHGMEL
jgi:hypothetical protein